MLFYWLQWSWTLPGRGVADNPLTTWGINSEKILHCS